eukprot:scaffold86_cov338-Pavlova_lutheri.AAC.60
MATRTCPSLAYTRSSAMADGMVPAKREIRPETEPVQSVDGKGIDPGSFLDASGGESIRGGWRWV